MNGDPEFGVLFVCTGNTCRSPLAEGTFRAKLVREGLSDRVAVDSAGTNAGNPGGPPDPRARDVARGHGIDIDDLRGRGFTPPDFERFDRILVLDRPRAAVLAQAQDDRDRAKVRLLRDGDGEVADPVYGGAAEYELAFGQIDEACDRLLAEVAAEVYARSASRRT